MSLIKDIDRNQKIMFSEYVATFEFKGMGFTKTREIRPGVSGYHPSVLMKLYLYGYLNGIRSSRKLVNI